MSYRPTVGLECLGLHTWVGVLSQKMSSESVGTHYCRMLLTRHYDQRPFDETVCDAIIANDVVWKPSEMHKTFAMTDASNTVQVLVACAMKGIRFSSINYLRWGGTKETGSQMKVCAKYIIRFTRMNCLCLGKTKEMVSQIKVCVIEGIRFRRINCLWLGNRTETGQLDQSVCDWWHTLHTDELFVICHNK